MMKQLLKQSRLINRAGLLAAVLCVLGITVFSSPAQAQCLTPCSACVNPYMNVTTGQVSAEHGQTRAHFGTHSPLTAGTGELGEHQRFLINFLFRGDDNIGGILPAWMLMSQQLTAVAMQQMWMVAEMFDAKHQLESQQLFREMAARTHKAYRPSTGMCIIGTNVRSLATADSHAQVNAFILGQRLIDRQLGSANVAASDGPVADQASRLQAFTTFYCDRYDNNYVDGVTGSGLSIICNNAPPQTVSNDIDYTRTIELPRTVDLDMTDESTTASDDERDIFELSANLFANRVFQRFSHNELMVLANHKYYQDIRALVAKRSVVQNTLSAVIGMKAQGSAGTGGTVGSAEDTATYMRHFLQELGMTYEPDMPHMLGDHGTTATGGEATLRPSYMAQMEMLTKRLYQNPEFFTDLYDSPANVKRKSAALQAIGLMLDRDLYDSYLRNEMLMSVLLEMRLVRAQRTVISDMRMMGPVEAPPP
ncbi:MAG: hypothetical protein KJ667_06975 [Alphaproteobacteria bacterium]|nr:hypothetical protein [Alphaproteobacteria bacterium]